MCAFTPNVDQPDYDEQRRRMRENQLQIESEEERRRRAAATGTSSLIIPRDGKSGNAPTNTKPTGLNI